MDGSECDPLKTTIRRTIRTIRTRRELRKAEARMTVGLLSSFLDAQAGSLKAKGMIIACFRDGTLIEVGWRIDVKQ